MIALRLRPERTVVSPTKRTLDMLVEISVSGAECEPREAVPRLLAIAIDSSNSMAGDKLETAKQFCVRALAKASHPHKLIVVSFAREARVIFNPDDDPSLLQQHLRTMEAGGTTALSDGWRTAKIELGTFGAAEPAAAKRIVLISDGEANIGERSPELLAAWCARAAEEQQIATSTIGVGSQFNEELLSRMAAASEGHFWFSGETELDAILDAELGHLSRTVVASPRLAFALPRGITIENKLNMLRLERERFRIPAISSSAALRYAWRLRVDGPVATRHTLRATLVSDDLELGSSELTITVGTDRDRALAPFDHEVEEVVQRYEVGRDQETAVELMRAGSLTRACHVMKRARANSEIYASTEPQEVEDVVILETALRSVNALKRVAGPDAGIEKAERELLHLLSSTAFGKCHRGFRSEIDHRMIITTVTSLFDRLRDVASTDAVASATWRELHELVHRST